MVKSLVVLFENTYNKNHPFFAIKRFIEWKIIKLFKISNYKKKIWDNKFIYLNYDSFQSMWIMYNWLVDWEEFNLIQDFIHKNDCCIDVGANMGFYTIWFSKFSNHIYSFEPNAKNFLRLQQNVTINSSANYIHSFNLAVGSKNEQVSFTNNFDGENHIVLNNASNVEIVECKRLDTILFEKNIKRISYIKIDVEGFELEVLKGLGNYLSEKNIDIIQIELNKTILNSGSTILELLEFVSLFQYNLCSYSVSKKLLKNISYSEDRENYFLVNDIEMINKKLLLSK